MDEKENFLFYNLLTDEEKESLKLKVYEKGEILVSFENIQKYYFILDGKVKLFKNLDRLKLMGVSILSKGYILGILVFLTGERSPGDAIAATDIVKVIEIDPNIIKRLKEESLEFNSYLLDLAVKRGMETVEALTVKNFSGIKGIIAYYLIRCSENGYLYIENYDEVIDYLNISHNGFYSTLNKLVKDKLIEKSKNSIKILDAQKLKELYMDFLN
ncbi:Crp/Fnr family transcriptional regulator [Psychrilyobacter atlanticus]|uniref:Crp/Fnr family transcriptional regulator n=1 Tax=Psychrilyobacter atlanticus TaxID=271091 RepID=UPI00146A4556|nr:Crp/Fnr family transcriptional regulator [Psychrilyobacter atlanticus]